MTFQLLRKDETFESSGKSGKDGDICHVITCSSVASGGDRAAERALPAEAERTPAGCVQGGGAQ